MYELSWTDNNEKKLKQIYSLLSVTLITGFYAAPASTAETYISGNVGSLWMNDTKDRFGM